MRCSEPGGSVAVAIVASPAPGDLSARALSSTRVELTWAAPSMEGVAGIIVQRWSAERGVWVELDEAPFIGTRGTNGNLSPETLYRYRVASVNAQGERSPFSNEAQVTTPAAFQNYKVVDLTAAIAETVLTQHPVSNPLTNSGWHNYDVRRTQFFPRSGEGSE